MIENSASKSERDEKKKDKKKEVQQKIVHYKFKIIWIARK